MMAGDTRQPDQGAQDPQQWVCVGVISGAHGIRGEVRLRSYTEDMGALATFERLVSGPEHAPVRILSARPHKGGLVARLEGVGDRNAAEALKGRELFVSRSDLPPPEEGEYYFADLEGLAVEDDGGRKIGAIRAVLDFGAGPLLELELEAPRPNVGRAPMVPFTGEFVPEVDIAGGRVVVLLDSWLESLPKGKADSGSNGQD